MEKKFGSFNRNNGREYQPSWMEIDVEFEDQLMRIEWLYGRIQTYRALRKVQHRHLGRFEVQLFDRELLDLRKEIEEWL